MTDARLEQIFTKRDSARKEIVNVDEPVIKLVIFLLGKDLFALHGDSIREILANAEIFFVPGCPSSLEGVINVRGDIESVIRLHDILQLPPPAHGEAFTILLGRTAEMSSGLKIDRVVDVIDVTQSSLLPPPSSLPENVRPFVSSLLNFREQPVTVLCLETIFSGYLKGMG